MWTWLVRLWLHVHQKLSYQFLVLLECIFDICVEKHDNFYTMCWCVIVVNMLNAAGIISLQYIVTGQPAILVSRLNVPSWSGWAARRPVEISAWSAREVCHQCQRGVQCRVWSAVLMIFCIMASTRFTFFVYYWHSCEMEIKLCCISCH